MSPMPDLGRSVLFAPSMTQPRGDWIGPREHADLIKRVDGIEVRVGNVETRVDRTEARQDRLDGMLILLRAVFGASVIAAIAGVIALIELLRGAT